MYTVLSAYPEAESDPLLGRYSVSSLAWRVFVTHEKYIGLGGRTLEVHVSGGRGSGRLRGGGSVTARAFVASGEGGQGGTLGEAVHPSGVGAIGSGGRGPGGGGGGMGRLV